MHPISDIRDFQDFSDEKYVVCHKDPLFMYEDAQRPRLNLKPNFKFEFWINVPASFLLELEIILRKAKVQKLATRQQL